MVELWYGIISFMMITYVVLDGRNFGAGVLHLFVARTLEERRQVAAAIGPLWVWHEVWLVAFGGTLFVAFPTLLAVSFSGYYLALFLILWCLALRGIALEVGGHFPDPMWQSFWNVVFFGSSCLLAILFGAALGNLSRGDPVDANGEFTMAFFTNFSPFGANGDGKVGLLDWYTVSMGVVVLIVLAAHGATYLTLRTTGPVHDRCAACARRLWLIIPAVLALIGVETTTVRPSLIGDFFHHPLAWFFGLVSVAGAGLVFTGIRAGNEKRAFFGSGAILTGLLAAGAATIYPVILFSTLTPENSLTAAHVAATTSSLKLALIWWPVAVLISFAYLAYIARHFSGKIAPTREGSGPY
jgi:cytochrome d ubiquinol oxidase subunit II